MPAETEIKFKIDDVAALEAKLQSIGFRLKTPSTLEVNTLYDLPSGELRAKAEVLRIRRYGDVWKATHKTKGTAGRHKVRAESETKIEDGEQMDAIFRALGYTPTFVYEKYRAEWTDGHGEVVVDRTPIGDIGEIEGEPGWIDKIATKLGVPDEAFISKSYAALFQEWRTQTGSKASNMTFEECEQPRPRL
jgi:adenylate cyclase, class 2